MKNRPHKLRAGVATKIFGVRLPLAEAEAVIERARAQFNGNVSQALVALIQQSLGANQLSGLGNEDAGYNAGLRRASHDAKVALRDALSPLWKK